MKAIMCEITEIKLENNEVTIKIPKDYQISLGNAFIIYDQNAVSEVTNDN